MNRRAEHWRPRDRRENAASDGSPRLFVAVPLAPDAVRDVERLVAELPTPGDERPVRWVRTDGLHLTLRFLGPTPADQIPVLVSVLDAVAEASQPFDVTIAHGGAFPSVRRPRALWLGVGDGEDGLAALAGELERGLVAHGWSPEERPFRAHLTLARADGVRSGPATAAALVAAAERFAVTFRADRLVLFQSHTGGGPARYEALHEAVLGARPAAPMLGSAATPQVTERSTMRDHPSS